MKDLTQKQARVLQYIKEFIEKEGIPPSVRTIRIQFSYRSNNAVVNHLKALERKGYLQRKAYGHKALELINFHPQKRRIPVLGTIAAGTPVLARENDGESLEVDALLPLSENAFILRVKGDSMIEAQIKDGDWALIRHQSTAENGQIIAALIDDEATLKFYYKHEQTIELRPANSAYQSIVYKKDDEKTVSIIGKLMSVIRNYS